MAGCRLRGDPGGGKATPDGVYWYLTRNDRLLVGSQDPATVRFFLVRGVTIPAIFLLVLRSKARPRACQRLGVGMCKFRKGTRAEGAEDTL
jgi:hypothetical protein